VSNHSHKSINQNNPSWSNLAAGPMSTADYTWEINSYAEGGNSTHNNLQPYIIAYKYKRTA